MHTHHLRAVARNYGYYYSRRRGLFLCFVVDTETVSLGECGDGNVCCWSDGQMDGRSVASQQAHVPYERDISEAVGKPSIGSMPRAMYVFLDRWLSVFGRIGR